MIRLVTEDKRDYMELLLMGDEQEELVMGYLDRGELYVLEEGGEEVAVCVVTDEGGGTAELKNIAVSPEHRRKGFGRALLSALEEILAGRFDRIVLGTGDSPLTVPFYESCGYHRTHTVPDYFTKNYDHPIIEAGVLLRDMVCFEKSLRREK
ncbi:MAG: GNAT family N-acetyltransferase [Ruminococcus sp.]|nr:GNAT family N-acetyltransferase [Ruminococcus sp.]